MSGQRNAIRGEFGPPVLTAIDGMMATMMVTIDRAGRIVIPKEVRDRLALLPDVELELEVLGERIQIQRRRRPARPLEWSDDGRPYFRADDGHHLSDLDVQRLRDADQR